MSANARMLVLTIGALMLFGGTLLTVLTGGGGVGLMIVGALVMISVALERRYGIDFAEYFDASLDRLLPLAEDGLVRVEVERIVVTARGRLLLRNIAMCFDRYLEQPAAVETPRFSRTV